MGIKFRENFSYDFSEIDKLLSDGVTGGLFRTGLAIVYKGELIYRKDFGWRDYEQTCPAAPDDIFTLWSASKTITCTAAMQLVERGLISLDDELRRFIPEFGSMMIAGKDGEPPHPATKQITIKHLFTMTAGLDYDCHSDYIKEYVAANPNAGTLDIARNCFPKKPLLFEPGEDWNYSLCHDVLAAVVEAVSGMRYGEYLRKNIFEPLEMNNTYTLRTAPPRERLVAQYRAKLNDDGERTYEIEPDNAMTISDHYESGGAGMFSTVDDYVSFVSALAGHGTAPNGVQILRPESVDIIRTAYLNEKQYNSFWKSEEYSYGLGCRVKIKKNPGRSAVGEFGWDGAAAAFNMIDVDNELGLFLGVQVLGASVAWDAQDFIRNEVYRVLGLG